MIHTIAFSESQDEGGVQSFVAGVPDQSVRVVGDDITVPQVVTKIIGAMGCIGTTGTRCNLVSPTLRRMNPYEINPAELALFPTTPNPMYMHPDSPVDLMTNEALNAQITANPAAAEQQSVVVWLADGPPKPVFGKIFHARFEATLALVAGVWTNAQISFVDDLPAGSYQMVGSSFVAASAVAGRWYPQGGPWRPGFPILQTLAGKQDPYFRNGAMGVWFTFDQVTPPTLDVLSSAAVGSATYAGVMDLIAVGS